MMAVRMPVKYIAATLPLGRFGTPEEIAKAVLYLASDESRWTIGSEIVVDGGRTLNGCPGLLPVRLAFLKDSLGQRECPLAMTHRCSER